MDQREFVCSSLSLALKKLKDERSTISLASSRGSGGTGNSTSPSVAHSKAAALGITVSLVFNVALELARLNLIDAADELRCILSAQEHSELQDAIYPNELSDIDSFIQLVNPTNSGHRGGGVSESKSDGAVPRRAATAEMEPQSEIMSCVDSKGQSLSDDLVYRAVLSNISSTGVMPCPAQVIWVSSKSLPQDVAAFVLRAASFPKLRFAMIGVNKLTVPAREDLMRSILSHRQAQLLLVFTDCKSRFTQLCVMGEEIKHLTCQSCQ